VLGVAIVLLLAALATLLRSLVRGERWSSRLWAIVVGLGAGCQLALIPFGFYLRRVMFGPYPKPMPPLLPDRVLLELAGVQFRLVDAVVLGTALVLMVVIQYLVFHTKIGTAMRAVSFNHQTAALMGINVSAVISMTFVLGSVFAAAAGFLYAMKYAQLKQTADNVWVLLGLKAFVAAVVGGIGNIRGAMLGGIFIGLIEFLGVAYVSDRYRDVYVFSILIIVLLIRPSGILGKATVEKV
jgi:branched-chain amino acid transport system permease protein